MLAVWFAQGKSRVQIQAKEIIMVAAHRSHHDILSLVLKGARLTFVFQPAFGIGKNLLFFVAFFFIFASKSYENLPKV